MFSERGKTGKNKSETQALDGRMAEIKQWGIPKLIEL